jgi:hypothetical protein
MTAASTGSSVTAKRRVARTCSTEVALCSNTPERAEYNSLPPNLFLPEIRQLRFFQAILELTSTTA